MQYPSQISLPSGHSTFRYAARWKRRQRALCAVLAVGLLGACSGGGSSGADDQVSTCEIKFGDTIIDITAASSRGDSGAVIDTLYLRDFTYEGKLKRIQDVQPLDNAMVSGNEVVCTVPCGFENEVGDWTFIAAAPGYQDELIEVTADYNRIERGPCGVNYMDEGTDIQIQLTGP